jgi:hypothetical protein
MNQVRDRSDFAIVVPSYLDEYGLDPYEYRVYSHIVRRAGKNGCFESIPNMAKCCLMNDKTVRSCLRVLLEAKLIIIAEARKGKSVIYEITPQKEWVTPDELPRIRCKRTPTKSGTTTPTKSGTTTPTKSGTTTPTKSGTTTPTKSGTTPLPNQVDEVFPIKKLPFKEVPLSKREEESPAQVQFEIISIKPEEATCQSSASLPTKPEILHQTENFALSQGSAASLTIEKYQSRFSALQRGGTLPDIELRDWANIEMGDLISAYRKSGRILTPSPNDINNDFAAYVSRANCPKGQNPGTGLGYSSILKIEKDPRQWQKLVAWIYEWQKSKSSGQTISVVGDADRQRERDRMRNALRQPVSGAKKNNAE